MISPVAFAEPDSFSIIGVTVIVLSTPALIEILAKSVDTSEVPLKSADLLSLSVSDMAQCPLSVKQAA